VRTRVKDWRFSSDETVDVAVAPVAFDATWDHLCWPIEGSGSKQVIESNKIDVGDEVCITGLFSLHTGRRNNIPVVRIGNIAAMPHERVASKFGDIEAHLIEARSTGGLSGSPVFVNPTGVRHGILKLTDGPQLFLLGLMQGHFDTPDPADQSGREKINMGIGVVVPVDKIVDVICQQAFSDQEKRSEEELRRRSAATMD
jgi:hypothetical protein